MQSKTENNTMRVFYLLAIVFVVDGHTTLGNLFDLNGLFRYYSFHLMMFAFGSGYFFKFYGGAFSDFAHRAKKLLVPLYLWNVIYGVGAALLRAHPQNSVAVHSPEITVRVEIREKAAYIHGETKPGAGGIPVGTGGKAAILISGGLDSPVAAWMMAKRGVELTAIHFASPPYTSERAHEKVVALLKKVGEYAGRMDMITVPFTEIQEQIRDNCPEELATVIMRRFMMRAAERIARERECSALITGESLGQVASQTIQAIACTDAAANMPVFRPLIGSDKSEIVTLAHRIDTYDISIEPYEDCCTVFTPKHPRTRPTLNVVEAAEQKLDVEQLLKNCLEKTEIRHL